MTIDPRRIEVMDDEMARILRDKSPDECLRMVDGMWLFVRDMVMAGVRLDHPEWTQAMIERATARRLADAAN